MWRPAELAAARITGAETGQRAVPGFGGATSEVPKPEPCRAWPETTEPEKEGATLLPNGSEAKLPGIFDDTLCFDGDSVSRKQVQRWWEEVASEIQMITDAVDAKYELWRAKMAEKDQVIKKLAAKLKELTESPRQSHPPNVFGLSSAPPGSLGLRSPMRAANRAARGTPGSPSGAGRALAAAQSADGLQALLSGSRLGRAGSLSPTNRLDLINGRGSPPEERPGPRSRRVTVEAEKLGPAAAALQSPTASSSRKTQRPREAAERVQILYLRQEIAQLRRQNAELQGQVRAGDAQVDQLSSVVKELQEVQRSRVNWKDSLPSGSTGTPLTATQGAGSGASTPSTAMPCVATAPVPHALAAAGGAEARPVQRRMSMEGQPASGVIVASSRVSAAATQAQRASRRAAAEAAGTGERGSSASRPSSAFQRHKDQMTASRRVIVAPQASATGPPALGQMSRMFSPRSRHWQSSRGVASCASLREPAAASIAQAAQAVALAGGADTQSQTRPGSSAGQAVSGTSTGGSASSVAAFRSASVDNRNRMRISTARRSLRKH